MAWYLWLIVAIAAAVVVFIIYIVARAVLVKKRGTPLEERREWYSEEKQSPMLSSWRG